MKKTTYKTKKLSFIRHQNNLYKFMLMFSVNLNSQ